MMTPAERTILVRRTTIAFIVAVTLALGFTACKKSGGGSTTAETTTARIRIVAPQNGDVSGPTVHVKAELIGGTIVPLSDTRLRPNSGHIHLLVDGQVQTMGVEVERDVSGLAPGTHILQMEFVDAQHRSFNPRVIAAVTVTVQAK